MDFSIVVVIFALLMITGIPIWAVLLGASIPYFLMNNIPFTLVTSVMSAGTITSFLLMAFPLFTLAGRLMNIGGVTERIFNFADTHVGWIRGGMGHVNVLASMLFAGMSGNATADIGGLGTIEIEGMTKRGYDLDFSVGITLASSTVGPIIPPSIPIILYAVITGESVMRLFVGGIIPGIVMGTSLMIMVFFYTSRRNYPKLAFPTLRQSLKSIKNVFLPMLNPVIILAGMFSGVFTPTEAAAVSVAYSIFLGKIVYKELTWKKIFSEIKITAKFCSAIYVIIGASLVFSFIVTREQIAQKLVNYIITIGLNQIEILFLLTLLVLLLGCFIEGTALIILILPIIIPLVRAVQISQVHFGVLFIMATTTGMLTPPFGLGLFMISSMTGMPFERVVKSITPFLIPLIVAMIIIILIPNMVLFLPNLIIK